VDESKLLQKLRDLEALFAGATTDGERIAAGTARKRILGRLHELERSDPPVEYRFTLADGWSKRLFLSLLRRYELKPYRYRSQRRTTVMVRCPKASWTRRCGRTFSERTTSCAATSTRSQNA
jgi:hypothetical protein